MNKIFCLRLRFFCKLLQSVFLFIFGLKALHPTYLDNNSMRATVKCNISTKMALTVLFFFLFSGGPIGPPTKTFQSSLNEERGPQKNEAMDFSLLLRFFSSASSLLSRRYAFIHGAPKQALFAGVPTGLSKQRPEEANKSSNAEQWTLFFLLDSPFGRCSSCFNAISTLEWPARPCGIERLRKCRCRSAPLGQMSCGPREWKVETREDETQLGIWLPAGTALGPLRSKSSKRLLSPSPCSSRIAFEFRHHHLTPP